MRICFIGKYPPIEGGVSAQTYWACRGLAERGHQVHVVTNAEEVDDAYRMRLDPDDAPWREAEFPDSGGYVKVFVPERLGPRMNHIPRGNPFVSKLAGLATQVVSDFGCRLIVAYYFEPYAVAGHLAASWTGVPLLVQHAGSDLDRLMRVPELATTYKRVLRSAAGVITTPRLVNRFAGMGVRREAIHIGPPHPPPPVFTPRAAPLRPAEIEALAVRRPGPAAAFDPGLPTIGMYGKPGVVKGTYDLIGALGRLRGAGPAFNLLLMSGAGRAEEVWQAVAESGVAGSTWVLPFLPHWKVPRFIRTCTAVAFLERDFPIAIHGPVVPREVLSCGTCLVLSGEILGKQHYRDRLRDGDTLVVAADPKDRARLADRLRTLIEDPEGAREIGARGRAVAAGFARYDDSVDAWEALLARFTAPVEERRRPSGARAGATMAERVEAALPWLRAALGSPEEVLARFPGEHPTADPDLGDLELAEEFCAFLARQVDDLAGAGGLTADRLRDIVRYQRARLWAGRDDRVGAGYPASPPVTNVLSGRRPSPDNIGGLCPTVAVPVRIEHFDHDVTPVFCLVGTTDDGPGTDWPATLSAIRRSQTWVGFARLPNLAPSEHRVNAATRRALTLCDGRSTTEGIVGLLSGDAGSPAAAGALRRQVYELLRRLYIAGVLVFGEPPASAPAPLDFGCRKEVKAR